MMAREVRIEEGRAFPEAIKDPQQQTTLEKIKMIVTIKLVTLVEECGAVARRREECWWLDANKSYTDPSAGGAKAKRDEEGKYRLTYRDTSGENRMRDKRLG